MLIQTQLYLDLVGINDPFVLDFIIYLNGVELKAPKIKWIKAYPRHTPL